MNIVDLRPAHRDIGNLYCSAVRGFCSEHGSKLDEIPAIGQRRVTDFKIFFLFVLIVSSV